MNKFTKLLSVFVLAGAIGAGAGAFAGCGHKHTFSDEWSTDATNHWHAATCEHDVKSDEGAHVDANNNGKCDVCDYDMTTAKPATAIALDKSTASVEVGATVTLTATVTPTDSTDAVAWTTSDAAVATVSGGVVTGVSAGTATITATAGTQSATCTVTVAAATNVREIATVADLLAFRQLTTLEGEYKLVADIDLEGVTLPAPKAVTAEGVTFDGQGHTISNAAYTEAGSKEGVLFKAIEGGTVTNIKFLGCSISSSNESAGILAGECNAASTISKIEFNSCAVTTTSNYVGLLFARREGSGAITITMSEITVKNGCTTSCAEYGGLLIGDITGETTVNFKDLDINGEFKGSKGNGSFIAGRTRDGASVSVENAVINATMPDKSSIGMFAGGGAVKDLTINKVLVVGASKADLYPSNKVPTGTKTITNLVTVAGVTVNESTAQDGAKTATYLKDTLGFDFTDVWMEEGEGGFRLKAASPNVKSEGATIANIKVNVGNVKTRFKKGETFNSDGIVVTGVYSDGVQLVLQSNEFTVDDGDVKLDQKGTYKVHVKSVENAAIAVDYDVTVAEETGFKVYSEFVPKVYVINGAVDYDNLVVVSTWSDGIEERLEKTDYTLNSNGAPDMTAAGKQSVRVDFAGGYDNTYEGQSFDIYVVAAATADTKNTVTVNVDAAATTNGAAVEGVVTFTSVVDAIDYLEACALDKDVIKVVNVAAGTYKAKITTDLCNLTLIGANTSETDDKSVLTYSAVESTVNIVTGSGYGLNCATLHVTGENFTAKNITIRNDFDYINDNKKESSPQGLALTIAGDKAELVGVHLYGNQDTLYLKNGRAYFKDSLIEGNIDFIFGEATGIAFFDSCEIKSITKSDKQENNNGYVTAMKADDSNKPTYGYVFYQCDFTDDGKIAEGSMSLGRPWGAKATVAYISCSFTKAYSKLAYDGKAKSRWFDMSGNNPANADFVEYGSTGEGAITEAVAGGSVITDASSYTIANVFAMENGKCKWTSPWAGTNAKITLKIVDADATGDGVVYEGDIEKGVAIPKAFAADNFVPENMVLVDLYTNSDCAEANKYDYTTALNENTTLYAKYTFGDMTVTEYWSYNYTTENKADTSTATPVTAKKGKVTFENIVTNNDWAKFGTDAKISFKAKKGTVIGFEAYAGSIFKFGTDSVTAEADGWVEYVVKADADEFVISDGNPGNTYFKVMHVLPAISEGVIDIAAAINGSSTSIEKKTSAIAGVVVDASNNGKLGPNNGDQTWAQFNTGTIIKVPVAEGSKVTCTLYNGGTATISEYENGFITITSTSNTYIGKITVEGAAKTWNVTVASKTAAITGGDGITVEYKNKAGDTTSADDADFKMDGDAAYVTITLKGLKAGQTVTIVAKGFSGSTGKAVGLKAGAVTNLTATNDSIEEAVFEATTSITAPGSGTFKYTVNADGDVSVKFVRSKGNTTKITGFDITAA